MMAEWTTAGGALVLPKTWGPVPVKSKTADEVVLSMLTSRQMGVPSSMWSLARTQPSCLTAKSRSMLRTATSAFS